MSRFSSLKITQALLTALVWFPSASTAHTPETYAPANEESILLDPISVTGTRTPRSLTDSPVKTDIFTAAEIESRGGVTLADSLRLMPSVRFENDCQNCGMNQIQLLGLSTDYTAILFDGAPLYPGLAKVYGASLFPAIFIDRIEVVKGSSSVLYGPEAIAGVVNLITEKPTAPVTRFSSTLEFLPSNALNREATFRVSRPLANNKTAVTVYGLYTDRDGIDLTTDGFTEIPEFRNNVVGLQVFHNPSDTASLKATYQYLDQAHRGGDQFNLPEEQSRVAESLKHQIHTFGLDWKNEITPDFSYEMKGAYTRIHRDSHYGARSDYEYTAFQEDGNPAFVDEENPTAGESAALAAYASSPANAAAINAAGRRVVGATLNEVFFVDTSVRRVINDHELVGGVQARQEKLSDSRPNDPTIANTFDQFSTYGIFAQDIWSVTRKVEIVPGIRADEHQNVDGTVYSPRLALRYEPVNDFILRTSYAAGFNAPGAYNEDAHIGGTVSIRNAPGLKQESANTYSFGAEWYPAQFKRKVGLSSTVYYTQLADTFDIDDSGTVSGDNDIWLRTNGPESKVFFWENGFNWILTEGLKLEGSVSYIHARFDQPIERVTGLTTDEFIKRPEWTSMLSLTHHTGPWETFISLNYTGNMLAVGEEGERFRRTDAFYEVDLGVSYAFQIGKSNTRWKAGLGLKNILDSYQDDLDNSGEDRDPTYVYGPTRPRSVYLTLGAEF
jgi:outer membrane receptor for ferrienterochelin and colicins